MGFLRKLNDGQGEDWNSPAMKVNGGEGGRRRTLLSTITRF